MRKLQIYVRFCWKPALAGIKGNDTSDKVATSTNMKDVLNISFGKGETKVWIKKMQKKQDRWDIITNKRKYCNIQNFNSKGVIRKKRGRRWF